MSPILVVDDSESVRAALRTMLESDGYAVLEAANGAEALQILVNTADSVPALIILDLQMPKMSGWELARIARSYHRLAGIPLLVISVHEASEATLPGVAGHLRKPISRETLLAEVRSIVGEP